MADSPVRYQKLPGRSRGLLNYTRLWSGPDHLLQVKAWPGGESYRRFFYTDIQAVILRQTRGRMVTNLVLLSFALVTAGPFGWIYAEDGDSVTAIIGAVVAGVWLLAILINSLLGPKCETYIQTLLQTERIISLNRLRTAHKVLGQVQPFIIAAQPPAAAVQTQPLA